MNQQEAIDAIETAFPGKQHYISAHVWTHHGKTDPATFACTVYDPYGDGKNMNGSGPNLEAAVKYLLAKRAVEMTQANADEMFTAK
jgi:hypothetical protein